MRYLLALLLLIQGCKSAGEPRGQLETRVEAEASIYQQPSVRITTTYRTTI